VADVFEGVLLPDGELGRIVATHVRSQERTRRLPGRYALPGLVDAHAHLTVKDDHTLGGEALATRRLHAYASSGVSTVRDLGGHACVTLSLARSRTDGMPVVIAAGRFLAPEGRYFPAMYEPVPPEELHLAGTDQLMQGASWLKLIGDFPLMAEGGPVPGSLAPTFDLGSVSRLVDLAHERGARVAVHTQSPHAGALVSVGVDSVEHGEWLTEDSVRALGARRGAWTPTLAAITDPPPEATKKRRAYAAEASERLRVLLPLAVRSGVRVLAGTDTVSTVAREITLLARHGLDPTQALSAASTSAQEWLDPEPARSGSLVTYDADPREDLTVLESPVAAVIRGRRVR